MTSEFSASIDHESSKNEMMLLLLELLFSNLGVFGYV